MPAQRMMSCGSGSARSTSEPSTVNTLKLSVSPSTTM